MVFVNSMSDLFHPEVPFAFIEGVFATMSSATQHVFQLLTKRSERLRKIASDLPWPENVWVGVSCETSRQAGRLDDLRTVPASVRFVSLEPLLGPAKGLELQWLDWVIVGGESGPGARPMQASWVRGVRDDCRTLGIPFFFKQWGGTRKRIAGHVLDGQVWRQWPVRVPSRAPGALGPGRHCRAAAPALAET